VTPDGDGQDLQTLAAPLRTRFLDMHEAREVAFGASRDVIRDAANAIRAVHRGDLDRADALIASSREAYVRPRRAPGRHPLVEYGGFLQDAAKEYAEARITRAATQGEPVPSPEDVDVDDGSWLHGLAETVGELRRAALDRVRGGDIAGAERLLETQQEILSVLVTIDVPDALTKGLRRATDGARAITERTRGDLTAAAGQRPLREALDAHRAVIERMLDGVGEP
jgi:translin